ncbi:Glutathione S-transferase L3 [Spatholobus suberectus]|nr:Glutathione S-transferase L3 [Spatholobus suberectus]
MATAGVEEIRPPTLGATSEPPPLFDGTTRLYMSYSCPFAQRVWITRNHKGLQDKIQLVPIDLENRPAWYKEKVYPENKVPSLEHNGKVLGESLDLIKYVDANFEGPSLVPSVKAANSSFVRASFDYLENALGKFDDGPFFLGQFSLVDAALAPFLERLQITFSEVYKNDITCGRPKLATYIEELNKIDAYKPTKVDPPEFVEYFKERFLVIYIHSSSPFPLFWGLGSKQYASDTLAYFLRDLSRRLTVEITTGFLFTEDF